MGDQELGAWALRSVIAGFAWSRCASSLLLSKNIEQARRHFQDTGDVGQQQADQRQQQRLQQV
jgi:hypothetical protein